jgi:hypothetical protein
VFRLDGLLSTRMKTVVLATLSYATFMVSPTLVLTLGSLFASHQRRPDAVGDFLVVVYLLAVSSVLSTLGFVLATGPSAMWRSLATSRAVVIASVLGLVAPIASLFIAALGAAVLLPLFRSAPRLATTLFHLVPGVVLGAAALLIARTWPTRPARIQAH